jgi:multidrug efflux pump subunit AcrA (membrane-fusion protein)
MKEFWNNYKSKIIWALLLILVVWGIVAIRKQGEEEVKNAQVKTGTIKETVKVTGSVKSQNDTSLSFEKSGPVSKIYVKEGNTVKAGTILMSLSGGDSRAQVLEAEANWRAEKARLQNLEEGARTEEVDLKKITLSSAESDKKIATTNAFESARNALSSALDILGYKLRDTIKNSSGDEYALTFSSCNSSLEADVARSRKDLDSFVKKWESDLSALEKARHAQSLRS